MHVGFHKAWRGPHVDVAQSGYLDFRLELRREFNPLMGIARSSWQGGPSPNCRDPGLGQAGNQRLDDSGED